MTDYAYLVQSPSSGKWFIRPLSLGVICNIARSHDDAAWIVQALNNAHATGRAQLQAEMRELLGTAPAPTDAD